MGDCWPIAGDAIDSLIEGLLRVIAKRLGGGGGGGGWGKSGGGGGNKHKGIK